MKSFLDIVIGQQFSTILLIASFIKRKFDLLEALETIKWIKKQIDSRENQRFREGRVVNYMSQTLRWIVFLLSALFPEDNLCWNTGNSKY